jgi:hypothetical protein
MRDIERVLTAGEPPRRTMDQRPPRRGRRLADSEETPPHAPEDVDASTQETKGSGTLDVRV